MNNSNIANRTLVLPFFANIHESQIGRVADTLQDALESISLERPT